MDRKTVFAQLPGVPPERRWRRQERPLPVVVNLIRQVEEGGETRYLLIRRRHAPYAGKWALVGGKVDFGETLAAAAAREVAEETGLETIFDGLRGIVNERLAPVGPDDSAGHFLIFVCAVLAAKGVASEQQEGAVAWFRREKIDELHERQEIIPSDYAMFRQFGGGRPNLPYYEAEMIAADQAQGGSFVSPLLTRFDCVNG